MSDPVYREFRFQAAVVSSAQGAEAIQLLAQVMDAYKEHLTFAERHAVVEWFYANYAPHRTDNA